MPAPLPRFVVINKPVGATPLEALERYRTEAGLPAATPLAYAGRLDPLASGALLILIGEECKRQTEYHTLDKRYEIEVVFGIGSDTGDVMGLLSHPPRRPPVVAWTDIQNTLRSLRGSIELPYPVFSAKTVKGKPLHTWAMEGRLDEITIPTKRSTIYNLMLLKLSTLSAQALDDQALFKINTIPPVTEARKALGNDFRRTDIRASWHAWLASHRDQSFPVATIACTASSGTYMRTLANVIANQLDTNGLALSIHRTHIGRYRPLWGTWGIWTTRFRGPQQMPDTSPDTAA